MFRIGCTYPGERMDKLRGGMALLEQTSCHRESSTHGCILAVSRANFVNHMAAPASPLMARTRSSGIFSTTLVLESAFEGTKNWHRVTFDDTGHRERSQGVQGVMLGENVAGRSCVKRASWDDSWIAGFKKERCLTLQMFTPSVESPGSTSW